MLGCVDERVDAYVEVSKHQCHPEHINTGVNVEHYKQKVVDLVGGPANRKDEGDENECLHYFCITAAKALLLYHTN